MWRCGPGVYVEVWAGVICGDVGRGICGDVFVHIGDVDRDSNSS